jgi:hypothetical protein
MKGVVGVGRSRINPKDKKENYVTFSVFNI